MRRTIVSWFVLAGVSSGVGGGGLVIAQEQEASSTAEIMQEKLDHAQALLTAVVLRDFAAVVEEGGKLHDLSELQSWYVLPTPEYASHSEEFRAAAHRAVSAGRAEDAEKVVDAYSAMVGKCVECHDYMSRVGTRNHDAARAGALPSRAVPTSMGTEWLRIPGDVGPTGDRLPPE